MVFSFAVQLGFQNPIDFEQDCHQHFQLYYVKDSLIHCVHDFQTGFDFGCQIYSGQDSLIYCENSCLICCEQDYLNYSGEDLLIYCENGCLIAYKQGCQIYCEMD